MKKKIIITGISGFIGSALHKYLKDEYNIVGIDRRKSTMKPFYHQDIVDPLPDIDNVYAVIHLAANPGVRDSHENFEAVCKDNILGTQRIIDMCISHWRPKRLLLASSSSVYGDLGKDGHALKVEDGVSPRSPYAMSKVAGEALVETYKNCGMLDGIFTTSMRFFTVYGPNQRNELAIRAFTDWILKCEPIKLYGDGSQRRDFTHIDDICRGIEELLQHSWNVDIANIGSGQSISINEIIHKIADYLDVQVTIEYLPRNIYDVDCTKAHSYTNAKIDFDEGLKEQIEWQKKHLTSQ